MNRIIVHTVIGVLWLATPWATFAGETGMSYDDTVNPGAPPPHIAPPGGGETPKPLTTNTTPAVGGAQPQAGTPPREVQPGEETPQTDDNTASGGGLRLPRGTMLQPGGGDGTQTEDELYVGRKAGGVSTPGASSKGSSQGLQPGGGDGTQTEDELYVGRKLKDTPAPGDVSPGGTGVTGGGLTGQPIRRKSTGLDSGVPARGSGVKPIAKGPGAIVIPRQNCGTHWTAWVADPNADVNPCPTNCERGERQVLNNQKSGNTKQYKARYQCYLPEMVVNQTPEMAKRLEAGAPAKKNCGTFWTGSVDDPNADVNPCPKNCERGELQVVNRNRSGNALQYSMRYQCYMAEPTTAKSATGSSLASTSGTARKELRKRAGAEITTQPTLSATQRPTGGPGGLTTASGPQSTPSSPVAGGRTASVGDREISTKKAEVPGTSITAVTDVTSASQSGTGPATGATEPHPVSGTPQGVSIAGGQKASSTSAVDAAPAATRTLPGANERQVSTKTLAGAGTTILALSDVTATSLKVKWKPVAGASAYELHAAAKGLNHSVTRTETRQAASPHEMAGPLTGLAPGVEHTVWVTVNYPDGKRGMSDQKTVTTAPAENPKGFKATSIGPGAVRLEWQASPGASHYLVQGDNLPRMQTTDTAVAVSNLTPATHEWTLIAVYPPGVYNDLNPSRLIEKVAPDVSGRGRYRVTINGFKVNRETLDDPLQRDGKGDEVFVAAYVAEYDTRSGQRTWANVGKSHVFGDINGFGAGRILAGTVGQEGGLKRDDIYPAHNPAVKSREPTNMDMPYLVWKGELTTAENYLVIVASVWEWDGDQVDFDRWENWWKNDPPVGHDSLKSVLADAVSNKRFSDLPGASLRSKYPYSNINAPQLNTKPPGGYDRPIGMSSFVTVHKYFDVFHVINREFIENVLAGNGQTPLPPGVFSLRFRDDDGPTAHVLNGDYTLYLQVERMP